MTNKGRAIALGAWLLCSISAAQTTANFDASRGGSNSSETSLTIAKVSGGNFNFLGSWYVNGEVIFAQPLKVDGVVIGGTTYNLLIVATMANSVYAFDADHPGVTVWSNLAFATPYASYPILEGGVYGSLGCLSTPVVDVANSKLYVVCDTSTPTYVIRQLSLTTGATLLSTNIAGQVTGTGDLGASGADGDSPPGGADMTSGANLLFYTRFEFQRASLALFGTNVYVSFGGLDDSRPYHGWVMSYSTVNLTQTGIWCSSPNGWGGAIWMSGGAPAIDGSGNLYFSTGNGTTYDGSTQFSNTVVKLSAALALVDWFEPSNAATIDAVDADVSSNRVMLIPGTVKVIAAGKDFNVYVIDTTCMGHVQGSSGCTLQTFQTNAIGVPGPGSGSFGGTYSSGLNALYLPTTAGTIYGFAWGGSTFTTTPFLAQTNTYFAPGPMLSTSSNGASNGILWTISDYASAHVSQRSATLKALKASDGTLLFSAFIGTMSKFVAPLILDGVAYIPTNDRGLLAYSFLPSLGSGSLHGGSQVLAGSGVH